PLHPGQPPAPPLSPARKLTNMATVVVVEDADQLAAPLARALERDGYAVERFAEGRPAVERLTGGGSDHVDLLLLDLGLPDIDGIEVCRAVRDGGYAGGIIILTARDGELDRVVGLDQGADDYLAKPFGLAELQARTRALLRRSSYNVAAPAVPPTAPAADPRATGGRALHVDVSARRIRVGDAELPA